MLEEKTAFKFLNMQSTIVLKLTKLPIFKSEGAQKYLFFSAFQVEDSLYRGIGENLRENSKPELKSTEALIETKYILVANVWIP